MSKKLDTILESEIRRFNTIIAYQDKMALNEVSYRFYNEADEMAPDEDPEIQEPEVDGTEDEMMDTPVDEPAIDGTEDDMMDTPEPQATDSDEGVTEIDVTELVNNTNDIKGKLEGIGSGLEKINDIVNKINKIETNLVKMDNVIDQLNSLARQVELMRPPTEEERRKALAKDSYPFNVTVDDYNKGVGPKNQTELENSSKMSMFDTLMKDYNETDVKRSFNIPTNNPFTGQ